MGSDKKQRKDTKGRPSKAAQNFYLWEVRGRGYDVFPRPVSLEPPFMEFSHRRDIERPIDDGIKKSVPGSVIKRLMGLKKSRPSRAGVCAETNCPEAAEPNSKSGLATEQDVVEVNLVLPPDRKVTQDNAEQFILNTASYNNPVGFEIYGTDSIEVRFACNRSDSEHVQQQASAFFPNAIREVRDRSLALDLSRPTVIIDFGLGNEFMLPFRTAKTFEPVDTLTGVIGCMESLAKGEKALLQILYQPVRNPWAANIMSAVLNNEGKPFLADMPESVSLAREKIQSPLLAVRIRALGQSDTEQGAWRIVKALGGALRVVANGHNELVALHNEKYDDLKHVHDVLRLTTHRPGMILNSRETATIVHPPSSAVKSEKLWQHFKKMKKAPELALYQLFKIGENDFFGKRYVATLSPHQLLKHCFISGVTGSGKTTTLIYIMKQIMEQGCGLMFTDPHGDAADQLLCYVPESRYQDVIYFDLSDVEFPLGIDLFHARTELERSLLKTDLTAILRRSSTSWGDQMSGVSDNAFGAGIENERPYTILHMPRFLSDLDFRRKVLETATDPQVKHYWEKVYPLLIGRSLAPILTRLGSLLRSRAIRNIFAQKNGLDFEDILETGKILIIKTPFGLIGLNDALTFCAILLAKMEQYIWARHMKGVEQRNHFFLAIDEVGSLITPSISSMLSSTRKFGVGLLLSGADLLDSSEQDRNFSNAIITHPSTYIFHRQGNRDARKLAEKLSYFNADDLQSLTVGDAVMAVEGRLNDFNIHVFSPPRIDPDTLQAKRNFFLQSTRERYGTPREKVEAELERDKVWCVGKPDPDPKKKSTPQKKSPDQPPKKITPQQKVADVKPLALLDSDRKLEVTEGKGGFQHRYLQNFIKSLAEDHGYLTVLEEPTSDGGSVDVGLRKGEQRIAVEISITTPAQHEYQNICKCLKEGYEKVFLCSSNERTLNGVQTLIEKELNTTDKEKILLFKPEDLIQYFQEGLENKADDTQRVKGYKVKIERQDSPEEKETQNKKNNDFAHQNEDREE